MIALKLISLACAASLAATAAQADRITVTSNASVAVSVARMTEAVENGGAKVFAVVDFAKGSTSVNAKLRPTTIVIFGSPRIGADALQLGQTMALTLPLKILFYEDASGQTWLTYDEPAALALAHGIPANALSIQNMQGALEKFASIGAGGS